MRGARKVLSIRDSLTSRRFTRGGGLNLVFIIAYSAETIGSACATSPCRASRTPMRGAYIRTGVDSSIHSRPAVHSAVREHIYPLCGRITSARLFLPWRNPSCIDHSNVSVNVGPRASARVPAFRARDAPDVNVIAKIWSEGEETTTGRSSIVATRLLHVRAPDTCAWQHD